MAPPIRRVVTPSTSASPGGGFTTTPRASVYNFPSRRMVTTPTMVVQSEGAAIPTTSSGGGFVSSASAVLAALLRANQNLASVLGILPGAGGSFQLSQDELDAVMAEVNRIGTAINDLGAKLQARAQG